MAVPGPFDRVWAQLRATALRPAPAAVYLVLLAVLWPAYRLWSVAPAHDDDALTVPVVATVADPGRPIVLAPEAPTLVRIPASLLAPGATPAGVALRSDGREAWSAPLPDLRATGGSVVVLLPPGAAAAGRTTLEVRGAGNAPLLAAPVVAAPSR